MGKGQNFERLVVKKLSLWWTSGKRDDIFWRTSGSGARATSRFKKGVNTTNSSGDICYLDKIGKPLIDKCLFELKKGYSKDVSILDFIDSKKKKPILLEWWNNAEKVRKQTKKKVTFLIFARDYHNICIVTDINKLGMYLEGNYICYDFYQKFIDKMGIAPIRYKNLLIFKFEDFLKEIKPYFWIN